MTDSTACLVDGCKRAANARGICRSHYGRAYRNGTLGQFPLAPVDVVWHRMSDVDPAEMTGTCSTCGVVAVSARRRGAYTSYRCRVKRLAESHSRSLKPRTSSRRHALQYKYGLTIEEFEQMNIAQGGKCAICECPSKLVVDHNHNTGFVRGLLCNACNVGIGFLKDSPARLVSAAIYLNAYTSSGA